MNPVKVRVFTREEDPYKVPAMEVTPDEGTAFYIKVEHPQGGSRIITVILGPKGGIDITRGNKTR